jgi:hypothetical protein
LPLRLDFGRSDSKMSESANKFEKTGPMTVEWVNATPGVTGLRGILLPTQVEAAFERAVQRVFARVKDGTASLATDAELKKLQFDSQREILRNWRKSGPCQYPGCTLSSIIKSHTLQRAGPLKEIASRDNHIIVPKFNYASLKIEYDRKGLDSASTFPGFCKEHERLFESFEKRGTLRNTRDYVLQLYRSVSREAVRTGFDIEYLRAQDKKVDALHVKKLTKLVIDEAQKLVSQYPVLRKFLISPEGRSDRLNEWLETLSMDLKQIQSMIEDLERAVTAVDEDVLGAHIHRFTLPTRLPVTLSGQSALTVVERGNTHRLIFYVVVIPEKTSTQILVASRISQARLLDGYLDSLDLFAVGGPLTDTVTAFVENFLFHGTDHWFFEENFWKSLPDASRQAVLDAVLGGGRMGVDRPSVDILPRYSGQRAIWEPMFNMKRLWEIERLKRHERGWKKFERLRMRQSIRLLESYVQPSINASIDPYSEVIFAYSNTPRRRRWAFVRLMRNGQWLGKWQRAREDRIN